MEEKFNIIISTNISDYYSCEGEGQTMQVTKKELNLLISIAKQNRLEILISK